MIGMSDFMLQRAVTGEHHQSLAVPVQTTGRVYAGHTDEIA
jgi:hypothetical protein